MGAMWGMQPLLIFMDK